MKRIIWTNDVDMKEWEMYYREYMDVEQDEVVDQYDFYNWIYKTIGLYLDDEKVNLNIQTKNPIICIAELGLWNGRKVECKELGCNINEIFNIIFESGCTEFYKYNQNIYAKISHHDETNYCIFRQLKEGRSLENFLDKLYHSTTKDYMKVVRSYTKSIAHYFDEVYGW